MEQLDFLLALGTVGMQIGAVVLFAVYFMRAQPEFASQVSLIQRLAVPLAFVLSLVASVMTLVYEFNPCPLCWIQRIFQYPTVIMLGMSLWREAYRAAAIDFTIVFSAIGACVAFYQHILQMYPMTGLPCPASGASCAQITYLEFGYITYPMMALSLFVFLIATMLFVRKAR